MISGEHIVTQRLARLLKCTSVYLNGSCWNFKHGCFTTGVKVSCRHSLTDLSAALRTANVKVEPCKGRVSSHISPGDFRSPAAARWLIYCRDRVGSERWWRRRRTAKDKDGMGGDGRGPRTYNRHSGSGRRDWAYLEWDNPKRG